MYTNLKNKIFVVKPKPSRSPLLTTLYKIHTITAVCIFMTLFLSLIYLQALKLLSVWRITSTLGSATSQCFCTRCHCSLTSIGSSCSVTQQSPECIVLQDSAGLRVSHRASWSRGTIGTAIQIITLNLKLKLWSCDTRLRLSPLNHNR